MIVPALFVGDSLCMNAKANPDWIGTARGRVGFVATPDNRLLIYATGGLADAGVLERQPELHAHRLDGRRRR